jgi:hypothetical protein
MIDSKSVTLSRAEKAVAKIKEKADSLNKREDAPDLLSRAYIF